MNKKLITRALAITFLLASFNSCKTITQDVAENGNDENGIYGEWINFNGSGGFQIKTISNGKETNKQYDEWGTLRQHRTSNLAIESDDDASVGVREGVGFRVGGTRLDIRPSGRR